MEAVLLCGIQATRRRLRTVMELPVGEAYSELIRAFLQTGER